MYQTYWNTSDHVSISALPQSQNIVVPSDQLQSLVAHNARSYNCYRRFVLLRRKWKWSPVSHQLLVSVQNREIKMKLSCFVSQMLSSGVESWRSGSAQLLVASWKFSSPVPVIVKVVTEERFATRRSRPMIMKKRTSSQRLHFYRRLKIRSRAAVTGVVMAADVSPHPADAAPPVRLQVRPQDVDHGDGFWIIVVIFQL